MLSDLIDLQEISVFFVFINYTPFPLEYRLKRVQQQSSISLGSK